MVESRLPKGAHVVKLLNSPVELSQESVNMNVSLVTPTILQKMMKTSQSKQPCSLEEAGLVMLVMLGLGRLFKETDADNAQPWRADRGRCGERSWPISRLFLTVLPAASHLQPARRRAAVAVEKEKKGHTRDERKQTERNREEHSSSVLMM